MSGPIQRHLEEDHLRLAAFLTHAEKERRGALDLDAFGEFRKGLLRHIGLEEKILIPAARQALGHEVPDFDRLRADHSRLVALLVPTPSLENIDRIMEILGPHNELEEGPEGLYAVCERALAAQAEEIVARMKAAPEVPVRPYYDRRKPVILNDDRNPGDA